MAPDPFCYFLLIIRPFLGVGATGEEPLTSPEKWGRGAERLSSVQSGRVVLLCLVNINFSYAKNNKGKSWG
ncbi:MAG: hypothetical protein JL50_20540 [Peptococcaceae bacterium BICA1-7]|nr:MAG: hypothetical protein JL50_20540 [Peptococcaceae bacterium BICA1-7]HBV98470.1 hypothetical protein [Desulfotomaculum sp.]